MINVGSKVKWGFRLAIYGLIVYGVYFAVAANADGVVRSRGEKICREVYSGEKPAVFIDEALKQGAMLVEGKLDGEKRESEVFRVKFPSSGPFKGYECRMVAIDGRVTTHEFYQID